MGGAEAPFEPEGLPTPASSTSTTWESCLPSPAQKVTLRGPLRVITLFGYT